VVVDGTPVRLWRGSCWRDAIVAYDAEAAGELARGGAWIEDGRGAPLDPSGAIVDGAAIFLVRADARRP
jgi:hypothetical protein